MEFSPYNLDLNRARFKQKELPVLFLTYTQDRKSDVRDPEIIDDRMASVEMACHWAVAFNLHGVDCFVHNLMLDENLIRYVTNKNILLFCYGGEADQTEIVERLLAKGVHGVIYDK